MREANAEIYNASGKEGCRTTRGAPKVHDKILLYKKVKPRVKSR